MTRFLAIFLLFLIVFMPAVSFGAGLIPCEGTTADPCNFEKLVELASNIINFLIMLTIPLTVIAFIYAGFMMITAAGNEAQVKKAKGIFFTVLKGFLFVLCAWLIVYTITSVLLDENDFINLLGYIHNYLS